MQRTRRASITLAGGWLCLVAAAAPMGCSIDDPLQSMLEERRPAPRDLGPPKRVFAKRFVVPIRTEPSPRGARLGYLRAGTVLHSTTTLPVGRHGCEGGWYELDTGGFVCQGRDVIVFSGERLPELRARQPDRTAVMPYEYATATRKTPVYKRLPRPEEVYEVPPDADAPDAGPAQPAAEVLEADSPLVARILRPGFYVSLDRTYDKEGVQYYRTQQNGFVAARHLRKKPWSGFHGQRLDGDRWTLPIAVTKADQTRVFRVNDRGKLRETRKRLGPRTFLPVHARRRVGDDVYLSVAEGRLVRERDVRVVQPSPPPDGVGEGERWIDIDLTHQVLVAYEWRQPRYVTLVSTGRTKTPSPELDYRTPKGLHRVRGKHLTSTMDNDEPGEPPYSLEDVPYVMYFRGAYAFHSAFWHDRFGRPRSHGCINLAPEDAKWLYNWSGPDLPETWHGGAATEDNPGTWVWVHGETPSR